MTLSIETTTIYTSGNEHHKPFNINFSVPYDISEPVLVPWVLYKYPKELDRIELKNRAKLLQKKHKKEERVPFKIKGGKYREIVQRKYCLFTDKLEESLENEKKYPSHGNNRTALAKHSRIKEIKSLPLSRVEGYVKLPTYAPTDYFRGLIDNIAYIIAPPNTSSLLPNSLQSALKSVPIFVLKNGKGEVVQCRNIMDAKSSPIFTGFNEGVLQKTSTGNMQFFFMSRKDLEDHKTLALQRFYSGGLAASCVGLDTAYRQVRAHGAGEMVTRYHIMPDSDELSMLVGKNIRKPNLVMDEEQAIWNAKRTLKNLHTPRITLPETNYNFILFNRFSKALSNFTSGKRLFPKAFQHSYRGTPIYLVQLQDRKYPTYLDKYTKRLVGDEFAGLGSRLVNFSSFPLPQGSLKEISTTSSTKNFIFFNYTEAAEFAKKNAKYTRKYDFFKMQTYPSLKQLNPDIFASSLEALMEIWEEASTKKESNNLFDPSYTYFVPTEEGINILETSDPRTGGPKYKTYKQDITVRFKILKGYIKTILLDGPLYVKSYQ